MPGCTHENAVVLATGAVSCQKCPLCNEVFIRCVHCDGVLLGIRPGWFFLKCGKCGREPEMPGASSEAQLPLFNGNANAST